MKEFARLTDSVCVITGGAGVLGAAIGDVLRQAGATTILTDLWADSTSERPAQLEMDVSSTDSINRTFERIIADHGHIDVLVNSAGFEQSCPVAELDVRDWNRMLEVHLTGTFLCSQRAFEHMSTRSGGKIINISSQLAYKGSTSLAHYCAAKAGVLGFTRAFAREAIAHNVQVNAIAPGPVDSPVLRACGEEFLRQKLAEMPIGRVGTPEEIAGTALLLASDFGDFYVGQTLAPCGGDVML